MQKSLHKLLLPILCLLVFNLDAQILAPYANYADTVNSSVTNGPDSLFIFNFDNDSTFIIADTQNYTGYTFQWKIYEHPNGFVNHSLGERVDFTPDTVAIGYRLIYSNGGSTDSINCWVVNNDYEAVITSKDFGDTLWTTSYGCEFYDAIDLYLTRPIMKYFNPEGNHDTLYYDLGFDTSWVKEKNVSEGNIQKPYVLGNVLRHRIIDPYWEGMWYTLIVTDSANLTRRDSVYIRSVIPKAVLSEPQYIKLSDSLEYPDRSDVYYDTYGSAYDGNISAPAQYRFIASESKNAQSYLFVFDDTTTSYYTPKDSVVHTYRYWGTFRPYLVARHFFEMINLPCYDTVKLDEKPIEIDKPKLNAPNAFSPPYGDNPYWRFFDVTVTDFEITIFNRNGLKVHTFRGNIRDWNGWDGSYKNSTNTVPTGVYFYVVKKIGVAPNIEPAESVSAQWLGTGDNTEYKGFIHVFNTEQ